MSIKMPASTIRRYPEEEAIMRSRKAQNEVMNFT